MTTALALGCGGVASQSPMTLPADFTGPGVYTVPAVPAVEFRLAKVRVEQAGNHVSIYYDLPAQLAGKSTWVELDGTAEPDALIRLSGTAGTSTCTVTPSLLRCDEHLTGLQLVAPTSAPPSSDPQAAAAQAFFDDPIGILTLPLPP
jgi:hypothetical protein